MTYAASLDKLSKILTVAVTAGLLAFFLFLKDSSGFLLWFGFLAIVFGLSYALRPLHYELHPNQLIVHRLIKPIVIERTDVSSAKLLTAAEQKGILRTFGSGGFFGYFGYFWSKALGKFTMQATRRDNLVLIEKTDGKKIVISPDDENFIHALKRQWKLG
jgi:hypothetical protein